MRTPSKQELQLLESIRIFLESMVLIRKTSSFVSDTSLRYLSMEDFLLQEGRPMLRCERHEFYHPKTPRVKKECFKNATLAAMYGLGYAEGYFVRASLPIPIHHAWNLLPDGSVLDHTIGWEADSVYFGVEVPAKHLTRITAANGFYGVLCGEISSTDFALGLDPHFPYSWRTAPLTSTLKGANSGT